MMIMLSIYIIVFSIIIFKGFYKSIPFMAPFSVRKNTEFLSTSIQIIQIESLPFYINQGKINLFVFFINFILISFFSLTLLPDLILNHMAFCQDYNEENQSYLYLDSIIDINNPRFGFNQNLNQIGFFSPPNNEEVELNRVIDETYEISEENNSFIYYLNYKHIGINNYFKVFEGFSNNINNILDKQNFLFEKIPFINKNPSSLYNISNIYENIYIKNSNTLSLISNAYKNIMLLYNNKLKNSSDYFNSESFNLFSKMLNNKINDENIYKNIRNFIGGHEIHNLNAKAIKIFSSLEIIHQISEDNYYSLKTNLNSTSLIKTLPIPTPELIEIKDLSDYCNQNLLITLRENYQISGYSIFNELGRNDSLDIHVKINEKFDYYNNYNFLLQYPDILLPIKEKGFCFQEKIVKDPYYAFHMDESILKEQYNIIKLKKKIEQEMILFERECDEDY